MSNVVEQAQTLAETEWTRYPVTRRWLAVDWRLTGAMRRRFGRSDGPPTSSQLCATSQASACSAGAALHEVSRANDQRWEICLRALGPGSAKLIVTISARSLGWTRWSHCSNVFVLPHSTTETRLLALCRQHHGRSQRSGLMAVGAAAGRRAAHGQRRASGDASRNVLAHRLKARLLISMGRLIVHIENGFDVFELSPVGLNPPGHWAAGDP